MDSSRRRPVNHLSFGLFFVSVILICNRSICAAQSSTAPSPTATQSISPSPSVTPSVNPSPTVTPSITTVLTTQPTVATTPIPNTTITPRTVVTPDDLSEQMDLGDGVRLWHPTRRTLGMVHRSDYTPENPKYAIKEQTLRAYLTALAPYVRRTPVRAKINLGSSSDYSGLSAVHVSSPVPLKVIQGHPGATLDIEGSINEIDKIVIEHPTQTHIVLALHTISPPKLDAIFDKLSARLAHYVTHFNPGEVGRTETVRRAISLVDGKVVQPGEIFSINETVGERTAARGFGIGFVFVDGHLDKQLGGGMCQVATTLYNAVLLAHLKVIERHAHARTVPYVEPGQDATVYWGSKDFKFQNDTDSPIYISYRTTATHAICDLYGKYVPGLKVRTVDTYERLGQRHFTSRFRRYTTLNGKTTVDYESYSDYNWTPALDYTM